jgi:hypothetical protein
MQRAQIYPSPFWYLARITKAGELNHEKGFPEGIPIVPIAPLKTSSFESQSQPMARTQSHLQLALAVTVRKSQGLTLPRIRLGLGTKELDWEQVKKLGGKFLQLRL